MLSLLSRLVLFYYQGYEHSSFPSKLAGAALLYEMLFNISYMASRVSDQTKAAKVENSFVITLAIVHGTLLLLMFILSSIKGLHGYFYYSRRFLLSLE